jgi:hypothetical protein
VLSRHKRMLLQPVAQTSSIAGIEKIHGAQLGNPASRAMVSCASLRRSGVSKISASVALLRRG